jgi:hypothetical protein
VISHQHLIVLPQVRISLNKFVGNVPVMKKKNDAATNTQYEHSSIPDLISFQINHQSPTFDKAEETMWNMRPMSNNKKGPIFNDYDNDKLKGEEHHASQFRTERRLGGGFMVNKSQHV